MTNTTHRIRVVLKLPKSNVASLLALARAMVQAFQSNPNLFPQPVPLPAIVQTHVQDLDVAQQATTTRTKGTIATRNAKRALLVSSLEAWRAYVQTLCDANPEQAEALIAAAGMAAAKVPLHAKPLLGARLGALSGWQYSADGGKTWTNAPASALASTTLTGLTPATTYSFRVAATVSKTVGEWSQAITVLVR